MRKVLQCAVALGLSAAVVPTTTCIAQPDTSEKSQLAAGALSYFLPGAGSLYAGNGRHALVHAAIGTASWLLMATAMNDPCPNGRCSASTQARGIGGLLMFGTNSVWSVVTAVRDVNAHNAAIASARARDSIVEAPNERPGGFGFRGMHVAFGGGVSPYLDQWTGAATSEGRIGITLFRDWTFVYAGSQVEGTKSTDYFVRDCNETRGCFPEVRVQTDAFELQRRWHREHRVHPIAMASVGSLVSRYAYHRGSGIVFGTVAWDSTQYRQFASVNAGLEADIWGWFHTAAYGGYRQSTGGTIPNGRSSNSGPVLAWLLEIGKF